MIASSHSAGANFVFGDGSVRLITYGIDPEQFHRACLINDGHRPSSLLRTLVSILRQPFLPSR